MIGPSIILAGLSIGSGEFVLWPRLTAEWGFALFWACWTGVTIQFFLNMEIERWTLATGESAVVGFVRLSRAFGPIFLVCATLPWIWPGWATGAATLLSWELRVPVTATAIGGLVLCGLILSVGPVVYRTVEALQLLLVGAIFTALLGLTALLVRADTVVELCRGALRFGSVPEGIHLPMLLGALAFAGAGGSVNLAQSNYIKDKGYGMGHWIGRITSPFTGREEPDSELGAVFQGSEANLARWRIWWRRANSTCWRCSRWRSSACWRPRCSSRAPRWARASTSSAPRRAPSRHASGRWARSSFSAPAWPCSSRRSSRSSTPSGASRRISSRWGSPCT
jgi:hypothetical protein